MLNPVVGDSMEAGGGAPPPPPGLSLLFDVGVFGAELAPLLDGLQRIRDMAPTTTTTAGWMHPATDPSFWAKADALTLHFRSRDTLTMGANTHEQDLALARLLWVPTPTHPIGLSTGHVRAMLRARRLALQ